MVRDEEGIYLLCGEEDFLKEEAKDSLISTLLPVESKKFSCDIYNAKDDYRDIFDALNTLPFLSSRRVIVVKDVEDLPEARKNPFLTYLKHPLRQISLILQSSQTPLSDKFIKAISHYAKTSLFNRLRPRELRDWIYRRLKRYKKSITKEGLGLLLELKGSGNLAILSGELEKLITYKGQESTIKKDDVIELVGKSVTKRVFDLIDALSNKDRSSALSIAHELFLEKQKEMPEVMGFIGWQLRRIWKAKSLLAKRKDQYHVARELKIRGFSVDKFFSQVRRFNIEELERDFNLLVEADRSIKSGHNNPRFVLEQLIIKLCSS